MGQRITFSGRGRECSILDNWDKPGTSLCEPTLKFVKGWLTGGTSNGGVECGDGTAYPMLVTPAQLAEIMYRVKRSKLESVALSFTRDESFTDYGWWDSYAVNISATYSMGSGSPPSNLMSVVTLGSSGYKLTFYSNVTTTYSAATTEEVYDPETDEYSRVITGWEESDPAYYSGRLDMDGTPAAELFGDRYTIEHGLDRWAAREATAEERAIWSFKAGPGDHERYYDTCCGFSHFIGGSYTVVPGESNLMASEYGVYLDGSSTVTYSNESTSGTDTNSYTFLVYFILQFNNRVAFVGDSPTESGAKLYLGVDLYVSAGNFTYPYGVSFHTLKPTAAPPSGYNQQVDEAGTLKLELSSDYVECKVYSVAPSFSDHVSFSYSASCEIVLKATEWWTYATKGGDPVWEETTGNPINGGPGE